MKDGRYVYAICKKWPGKELRLRSVFLGGEDPVVQMPGTDRQLEWWYEKGKWGKLVIEIPADLEARKPCDHAYVIKMQLY